MNARPFARLRPRFFIPSLSSIVTIIIVIGALALAFAPRLARAAGSAFVRVNQVGYATTATKRAYLMASGAETGATFSVKNTKGVTVYSAAIGANLGSWSSSYPDVYALDFGAGNQARHLHDLSERADYGFLTELSHRYRHEVVYRGII